MADTEKLIQLKNRAGNINLFPKTKTSVVVNSDDTAISNNLQTGSVAATGSISAVTITGSGVVSGGSIAATTSLTLDSNPVATEKWVSEQLSNLVDTQYVVATGPDSTPNVTVFWDSSTNTNIAGTLVAGPATTTPQKPSTIGKIYLVPSSEVESGVYVEWITYKSGSTYSWERIGTTAADLNEYVKNNTDGTITGGLTLDKGQNSGNSGTAYITLKTATGSATPTTYTITAPAGTGSYVGRSFNLNLPTEDGTFATQKYVDDAITSASLQDYLESASVNSSTNTLTINPIVGGAAGTPITFTGGAMVTTAGSESITIGSDTLNVVTRDTAQDITGVKTFKAQPEIYNQESGAGIKFTGASGNAGSVTLKKANGLSSGSFVLTMPSKTDTLATVGDLVDLTYTEIV